jgi:hypothetical protein
VSRLNTITNMAAVTASTKSDNPKIEWAGERPAQKYLLD